MGPTFEDRPITCEVKDTNTKRACLKVYQKRMFFNCCKSEKSCPLAWFSWFTVLDKTNDWDVLRLSSPRCCLQSRLEEAWSLAKNSCPTSTRAWNPVSGDLWSWTEKKCMRHRYEMMWNKLKGRARKSTRQKSELELSVGYICNNYFDLWFICSLSIQKLFCKIRGSGYKCTLIGVTYIMHFNALYASLRDSPLRKHIEAELSEPWGAHSDSINAAGIGRNDD